MLTGDELIYKGTLRLKTLSMDILVCSPYKPQVKGWDKYLFLSSSCSLKLPAVRN